MTTYSLAEQHPTLPGPARLEVSAHVDRDPFNGLVRLQMTPPETGVTTTYWLADSSARAIAKALLGEAGES